MEAAALAVEIHLWGVSTLYPRFFEELEEAYDEGTSHLVRACIQPDRYRRYALSDVKYKREYRRRRRQQQQQQQQQQRKQRDIASIVTQSKGCHLRVTGSLLDHDGNRAQWVYGLAERSLANADDPFKIEEKLWFDLLWRSSLTR